MNSGIFFRLGPTTFKLVASFIIPSFVLCFCPIKAFAAIHDFVGGNDDGAFPRADLSWDGSLLYGATNSGGDNNRGVIFSMSPNGTNFTTIHEFTGVSDGYVPETLTLSAGLLYGTTFAGGGSDKGTVFSLNTNGSNFTVLHNFGGGVSDGRHPDEYSSVTISGSKLFGTTWYGGLYDNGVAFSMNLDGTSFSLLHHFGAGSPINDGANPIGGLVVQGTRLYGVTPNGGFQGKGSIYSMNLDGSDYQPLHTFAGGATDGAIPYASLTSDGTKFYGVTSGGGDQNDGTIFSMNPDGSAFTLLNEFLLDSSFGDHPRGGLTLNGAELFGTTFNGGNSGNGVIFSVATDGTNYQVLSDFAGGPTDGANPKSRLTLVGNQLFGVTENGGATDKGVVFSAPVPEPSALVLMLVSLGCCFGRLQRHTSRAG